jgi:hypothetical protein
MAQDSLALAQDSWLPQLSASFVSRFSSVCAQSLHAPPGRDGGQVVECGGSVVVLPLPLPRQGLKPPWDETCQIPCSTVTYCPCPLYAVLLPPIATPVVHTLNLSLRCVLLKYK